MSAPLRVLVVDDEPLAVERLQILLGRMAGVQLVGAASGGWAALRMAETLAPDMLLLDVAMPDVDGIDVARALARLQNPPKVVFATAFDSFAVAAFDLAAVDYLMKPIEPARLERALERVREAIGQEEGKAPPGHDDGYLQEFWASDRNGLTRIRAVDVDRITAERDYMRIHVGTRSWLINHSLSRLEQELSPELFVRLHRGAMVRRDFIAGLRHDDAGWVARLADGEEQRVGRAYAENARKLSGRTKPGR